MTYPVTQEETGRLDCPHCPYETSDLAAFEVHITSHSQGNPNKTPQPEQSIRVGELASLLVHQCQVYMDRTTWPDSDVEIERLARHLAVNLLADHEVIPKRICPRIRKPRQKRRNP